MSLPHRSDTATIIAALRALAAQAEEQTTDGVVCALLDEAADRLAEQREDSDLLDLLSALPECYDVAIGEPYRWYWYDGDNYAGPVSTLRDALRNAKRVTT